MKRLIITIIILSLAALTYAQTLPTRVFVATDALNVRSAPDNTSDIIATVNRDTVLRPLQAENGWYNVEVVRPDKLVGWVNAAFVSENQTRTIAAESEITMPPKPTAQTPAFIPTQQPTVVSQPKTQQPSTSKNTIQNIKIVEGEGLHYVKVSMRDISRISCPSEIGLPFYSKEKEVEVQKHDKDLFVKILPRQVVYSDGRTEVNYSDIPREMYIKCGPEFFSLVLNPENIPAQHIILSTPTADIKEAIRSETSSEYEKTIMDFIKSAYLGIPPAGFKVIKERNTLNFQEATLSLNVRYLGYYYIIEEWSLTSNLKEVKEFDETAFIPVFRDVKALSIVQPNLMPKGQTRLLVVMLNNNLIKED
jgi:uncharacterized protein YgiM (DUF1202 family)